MDELVSGDLLRAAQRLRSARLSAHMTQNQLAKAIGSSPPYISLLESGKRNPANLSDNTLCKLCDALGVTKEYIVGDCKRAVGRHAQPIPDLTGMRFGHMVIECSVERDKKGRRIYQCQCDCGNRFHARATQIYHGEVTSCGCKRSGDRISQDMIGKRFEKLTVLERTNQKSSTTYLYLCRCDCGNTCLASRERLLRGEVVSCGCYRGGLYEKMDSAIREFSYAGTNIARIRNKDTLSVRNKSGVRGVCYDKKLKKWMATIGIGGKGIVLGRFSDKNDAISARIEAEKIYHDPVIDEFNHIKDNDCADLNQKK